MTSTPLTIGSDTSGTVPQINFTNSLMTTEAPSVLMSTVADQVERRSGQ